MENLAQDSSENVLDIINKARKNRRKNDKRISINSNDLMIRNILKKEQFSKRFIEN